MDVESGFQELDKRPGVLAFVAGATLIGGIAIGKAAIDAGHRVTPKPGTDTGKALINRPELLFLANTASTVARRRR